MSTGRKPVAGPLLVRKVRHLAPTVSAFCLDWLRESSELLPGTVITPKLPRRLLSRINDVTPRLRTATDRWFIVRENLIDEDALHNDGDRRPLNIVCVALLLTLNPNLRYGPLLGARPYKKTWEFFLEWHDELYSFWGPFRKLPTHFFDYDLPPSFEEVRSVAERLFAQRHNRTIALACDRYVRACFARSRDEAIVELSIALEVLLLSGGSVKRKVLARRTALALGDSPETRAAVYQQVSSLYKLRNRVMHEGSLASPIDEHTSAVSVVRSGRRNVANLIRLCVGHPDESFRNKAQFLGILDLMASKMDSELESYEKSHSGSLKQTTGGS